MPLHCCHGVCKSDSRKPEAGVIFITFPKPWRNPGAARRWVNLCARKNFTIDNITRNTYICSKHFPAETVSGVRTRTTTFTSLARANPNLEPFNASKQLKKVPAPRFKHYKVKALAKYDILHKNQAKDYQKAQINPVDPLSMRKSLRPQLDDNFDTIDDVEGQKYHGPSSTEKCLFSDSAQKDDNYKIQECPIQSLQRLTQTFMFPDSGQKDDDYKIQEFPIPSLTKNCLFPDSAQKDNYEVRENLVQKDVDPLSMRTSPRVQKDDIVETIPGVEVPQFQDPSSTENYLLPDSTKKCDNYGVQEYSGPSVTKQCLLPDPATKYDYHEVQEYLGLSTIKKPLFPHSAQKYDNCEVREYPGASSTRKLLFPVSDDILDIVGDQVGTADSDTDTASETESALWQDDNGYQNNIDVDPVPSPHKIDLPIYPLKRCKKNQGVQVDVDYTIKHELGLLRAQVKALQKENKALKEAIDKREGKTAHTSRCEPKTPNKTTKSLEGDNEFSWTKKLKFYTRLTMEQCSALYDNLDPKGKEVLLSVVSEANQGLRMTTR